MITEEIGWMVGESSAALKTTDGGLTWVQQQMPHTTLPYWDVSFVDINYGYIAGNSAIILKTTNGGVDWQVQIAGDNRSLFTVYTYDSLKVVAGGFAGKVVVTTDGGSNWQQINTMTANVNRIKFFDSLNGFAVTSGFNYQTTDGGFTWIWRPDLQHTSSTWNIDFPDLQNGYISGARMQLLKTTDAGVSWKKTIINDDFINVYFKDEQNGFINSSKFIYTTNDGGYTLDILETFPYSEIFSMDAMMFTDNLTGYIGTTSLSIYKTTNSGLDWYKSNITGLTDSIGQITKFFFIIQTTGWAVSMDGKIFKTIDSGENWFVQLDAGISVIFKSIYFIDSLIGWTANINRRPFKTTDSGQNWIEQTQLSTNFSRDIFFVDDLNGFMVESNELYQTTDGGNTFFLNTSVSGFGFGRFSNYGSDNIFITGRKVYRSINGGMNWVDFPEVQDKSLIYLGLLNIMSGYSVGNIGIIYKYYDETVPVELTTFSAELSDNSILLRWETATEINNSGFEIQRKEISDTDWIIIRFVNGKGTTTEKSFYSFMDVPKLNRTYEYRLKQIDFDGTFTFSDILKIEYLIDEYKLYQNYPNPFNPTTTIKYDLPNTSEVSLIIYDILGRKIKELVNTKQQAGRYEVQFNASNLASGVYIYQLIAEKYMSSRKMILMK